MRLTLVLAPFATLPSTHQTVNNDAGRQASKLDQAIAWYRKAIETQPGFADAHYNLGLALEQRGDSSEAMASGRKAIELDPAHAEAHGDSATCFTKPIN